jgi:hypothetical protein
MKKRQPQNARGSNQRPLIKKDETPKRKGLKSKTSDAKRGNLNAQGDPKSGSVSSPKPASPN